MKKIQLIESTEILQEVNVLKAFARALGLRGLSKGRPTEAPRRAQDRLPALSAGQDAPVLGRDAKAEQARICRALIKRAGFKLVKTVEKKGVRGVIFRYYIRSHEDRFCLKAYLLPEGEPHMSVVLWDWDGRMLKDAIAADYLKNEQKMIRAGASRLSRWG